MKKKILAILLFNFIHLGYCQINQVADNVFFSLGMVVSENNLYASVSGNCITKLNLNDTSDIKCIENSDTNFPHGLFLDKNDLYITGYGFGVISKIDISQESPSLFSVVRNLNKPRDIVLKDNILYIAEEDKISILNINDPTKTVSPFLEGISAKGLVLNDDLIYGFNDNEIFVFDVTGSISTVVDNIMPLAIEIADNILYISENNQISKIDLTDTSFSKTIFLTGVSNVRALSFYSGELYIAEFDKSIVSKVSIENDSTLSISSEDLEDLSRFSIYPNPTKEFIYFSEMIDRLVVFNLSGKKVYENDHPINKVNIVNLDKGVYLFHLNNKKYIKIIKE